MVRTVRYASFILNVPFFNFKVTCLITYLLLYWPKFIEFLFISRYEVFWIIWNILMYFDICKGTSGYFYLSINTVEKVPGIDRSKSPLKEIVKNLFKAKLAPLSSILQWSSSAICHSVCSQCSMLSVYLKCVSRFFQWIRISNKEFVSNFALQMEFRVRKRWKCYRRLTVNQLYQKQVHLSGTVHSKAVEMWWKICLALVGHQRLQFKLTSLKWRKCWLF